MLLKYGDTGSLTELLQLALSRAGYYTGNIDGIFAEKTLSAVRAFQRAFFLKEDGIAGEKTFEKAARFIKGYYTREIKKGDTLWNIAIMTGSTLSSIIRANPGIDPDKLTVGDRITVPFPFDIVPTDISYSSYLTGLILDGLTARYPFISRFSIGKSAMGKELEVIRLGTGKETLFANAGFHSNEWLNIPLVLKFAEEYLKAFSEDTAFYSLDASELYSQTSLFIAPLINPDGLDLVTGALTSGEYFERAKAISENYPFVPFPEGWKANINGTDLNLQFPAGWERAREIKFKEGFTGPSPIEYVGTAPLSEPEARAAAEYTENNDFSFILAFHSQGSIIYWKYLDLLPPDSLRIGELLSEASGYPLELTPESSSYAGYKDWFISKFNKPGYTVETGIGRNPLPLSQFDDIYKAGGALLAEALRIASEKQTLT